MLIEGLSPSSAYVRALAGHDWTQADYLLAMAVDALHVANELQMTLHADKHTFQEPEPVPRPEITAAARKPAAEAEAPEAAAGTLSLADHFARATQPGG